MEYTVNGLAKLAGVSPRTLRYYDQIGLLKPLRVEKNGYRVYGQEQVDALQQIRFFTELGLPLKEVLRLTRSPDYDRERTLESHLLALKEEKERIERLIENVQKTLEAQKGGKAMTDQEKFEGFKRELVRENEARYGAEIRQKYGDETVDASNEKLLAMDERTFDDVKELEAELYPLLAEAAQLGDPASPLAQKVCELHKKWLCFYWPEGTYSREAHRSLGEMYVEDPRFREFYDGIYPNAAKFLHDALMVYCS
ncbi:MAG: MerR family transcriptional regulator [Christensenellales bacterium]|jgi:DNA-binding transcriptional MerR regulator